MGNPRKKILVAVKLDYGSGRDIMSGLFRFLDAKNDWNVKLLQSEGEVTPEIIRTAQDDGVSGIIISFAPSDVTRRELLRTSIPLVLVGIRDPELERRTGPTRFIRNDNAAIGRLAASHFSSCGVFNSYGLVPFAGEDWSRERGEAFREAARKIAVNVEEFAGTAPKGSPEDLGSLARWLKTLVKPTAVFAVCDTRAAQVLEAAQTARMKVPTQVAILGSDNDEYLTSHTVPPLSSILPGHNDMGYKAGEMLAALMRRRNPSQVVAIIPPHRVVVRESTAHAAPTAVLIRRAREFIRENACTPIRTKDIAEHLGVSRSCLEHRFHEIEGRTIHSLIEECRLTEVKRQLRQSKRPIAEIAQMCGYSSANRLSHLFRQRQGVSLRDWRAQASVIHT